MEWEQSLGDEVRPLISLRAKRSNLLLSVREIATLPSRAPRNDMAEIDPSLYIISSEARNPYDAFLEGYISGN